MFAGTSLKNVARAAALTSLAIIVAIHAQDDTDMGSMPFWTGIGDKPLSLSSTGATPSATASPSPGSGSSSGTGTSSDNGGFGSGSGSGSGPGSGSGTGSADPGPDQGPDSRPGVSGAGGAGFDFSEASRARVVHGILAAMAMVVFFPTGAVLVRFLEGRSALWAHAVVQIFAVSVYVAAVAVGFHLAQEVRGVGVDFLGDLRVNYHPIIGLVVLACLFLQPMLGLIHHERFKKTARRQVWTHLHTINGRVAMTLGMVNGALGLWLARAPGKLKASYLGLAIPIWLIWVGVGAWEEWHRWRHRRRQDKWFDAREKELVEVRDNAQEHVIDWRRSRGTIGPMGCPTNV